MLHGVESEPWPYKRSKVGSGLRAFERLTIPDNAGLYTKQGANRKVQTINQEGTVWLENGGSNIQCREVIGQYPSKVGMRSVRAYGVWYV